MTTTDEIADMIASEQNLPNAQAKAIVETIFASITAAAMSGAETSIPGPARSRSRLSPNTRVQSGDRRHHQGAVAKKLSFQPAKALKDFAE